MMWYTYRTGNDFLETPTTPSYFEKETESALTLSVDIPGVKTEDLDISVEGAILSVKAKRDNRSYDVAWTLPKTVDGDKIEAEYEAGVLTLTIPKRQLVKPRRITITPKQLAAST